MAFVQSCTSHLPGRRSVFVGAQRASPKLKTALPTRSVRMLISFPFFTSKEVIALPQHDKENAAEREKEITAQKETYKWTTDAIGDASFIEGLPKDEYPELGWLEKMIQTAFRIALNNAALEFGELRDEYSEAKRSIFSKIASFTTKILQRMFSREVAEDSVTGSMTELGSILRIRDDDIGKGGSIQEYKDLFKVFKADRVAAGNQFLKDDVFGWYRVAGPNPMRITKLNVPVVEMFPEFTDDILSGIPQFSGDSLRELESDNRLFFVDYKDLDGLPQGKLPDGTPKDNLYVYAPTALLAVPKDPDNRTTVLPIAIRCGQGHDKHPMYTPNESHTDHVTWLAAKLTVQVADAVTMEAIYHLGRVHLLMEVFVCSLNRCLAPTHPLTKLLKLHFYGTALINYLAADSLTAPGGAVDLISAPQIETTTIIASHSVNKPSFQFNEWFPDNELANRGVLDADQLHFPYRDDSLKLWKAINDWIRCYVGAYYKNNDDVKNDSELRHWCNEIVSHDGGSLHGFGETKNGEILTIDYLVRMVSMLVFTASVQHAAVNFTQSKFMQFVPAMPLAGCAPAPMIEKPFTDVDHWVEEMIPDLKTALRQMNTAELIGVVRYTTLGDYGKELNFVNDEVEQGLEEFQEALGRIGAEIQERNRQERNAGLPIYDILVPKNIPQSTNV